MLAAIRDSIPARSGKLVLLSLAGAALMSCAAREKPPVISDPTVAGRESALPWNQQEDWETEGQMGSMADRMNPTGGGR